jgi:hypothetical protein
LSSFLHYKIRDVSIRPGIGVEVNIKMFEKVTVRSEVFTGK